MSEAGPSSRNDNIHSQQEESGDELDLCDGCDEHYGNLFFCQPCKRTFCDSCWGLQAAHRPTKRNLQAVASGDAPHEQTKLQVLRVVQPAFSSATDQATLEARLAEDEDAAWFGISSERGKDGALYFHDNGRYDELMTTIGVATRRITTPDKNGLGISSRTPSLVSFIGQTGAGKSTLIKLLIQLKATRRFARLQCPVVGMPKSELPTSEDVHLYVDPATTLSDAPILYADCEGLEAGTREPLAAALRSKREKSEGGREDRGSSIPKRQIRWAKSAKERTRNFAVESFYPRLLFTFSEVVVFVDRNPRSIESVLVKLIEWAAAALETACNQPILPIAIIVLNASRSDIDPELWDVDKASKDFMQSLAATVHRNDHFLKLARFWKDRGREIETIEQLILCYYTSIRVVRLPTDTQPNLVLEQAEKLYSEIEYGCRRSRDRKQSLRMLLDSDSLQSYLQHAFDHYTQTLDVPFDFVQASYLHNPIPANFGGNILKLAIAMKNYETKPNMRPDGRNIFKKISNLIASCIMLDAIRHNIPGTADLIFPQYLHHLDAALRDFCDRYWPCEYIQRVDVPDKWKGDLSNIGVPENMRVAALLYRCVNVQSGHSSKGHQMRSGRTFARGSYTSTFSFKNNQKEFHAWVYFRLENLLNHLGENTRNGESQQLAAIQVHRTKIREFYLVSNRDGALNTLSAHNVCWCCLFGPPEHSLSCGHMLCTECIRAYGHITDKTLLEIHECPLESYGRQLKKVYIKPEAAGIRTLVLEDGGMVGGISQLEVLRMIEEQFNGKLPIQFMFDMAVGKGMAAIITLGLFADDWSLDQCSVNFERVCKDTFSSKNRNKLQKVPRLGGKLPASRYNAKAFENGLKSTFAENQKLFGGPGGKTKVLIPASTAGGKTVIFTNFNRLPTKSYYRMYRPDDPKHEMKHWEIIRATTADPHVFRPYHHEPSGQSYADGEASGENLFVIAATEANEIWRSSQVNSLDLFLAIGTVLLHLSTSGKFEKPWNDFLKKLPSNFPLHNISRLSVNFPEPTEYDSQLSAALIRRIVRTVVDQDRIRVIASGLFASLFYFESKGVIGKTKDGQYLILGNILCRIADGTAEICEVGKLLKRGKFSNAKFAVQEQERELQHFDIKSSMIEDMIEKRQFCMPDAEVKIRSKALVLNIALHLENGELYSISGFPRAIIGEHSQMSQVSRDTAAIQPRSNWKPPDSETFFSLESAFPNDSAIHLVPTPIDAQNSELGSANLADDMPTAELKAMRQTAELEAPELRDHSSIQVAMKVQQQINPWEERVRQLEAEKRELSHQLAAVQNHSAVSPEFEPEHLLDSDSPRNFLDLDLPGPSLQYPCLPEPNNF